MRRFLTFLLAVFGALVLGAGVAHAAGDNSIDTSTPSADETISLAPTQIQLRFTKEVGGAEAVAKMGLVLTCDSRIINLGPPQLAADGLTVSAALTQRMTNGQCTVTWTLPDTSAGSYSFTSAVDPTTTVPSSEPGNTTPTIPGLPSEEAATVQPRLGGPIGLVRWIAFFFTSALFGGLIFIKIAWPEGVEYPVCEKYFRQISIVAIASLLLLMMLMSARQAGTGLGSTISPTAWGPLFETNEGRALFIRFIAVCGMAYFAWITERINFENLVMPSTIALVFFAMSFGFDRTGGRFVALGVLLSISHMALVATWVGAIAIIWRVVLYGPGNLDLVHALRGWSRIANLIMVGIIVTGAVQVYRIDNISLINSGHGRVILLKTLIVAGLIFVDSTVRQFVLRGMQRAKSLNEKVVYRLKRPVGFQLSLTIVVLATSSWLMSMRPPYVLQVDKGPRVDYAIVQDLEGEDDFRVRVSITPGNVGANRVLIELFGPSRIQKFTVKFTPDNPNFSGFTINVPITRPGAALVAEDSGMLLRAPGNWKLEINGVTTIGVLKPLTSQFVIADGVTVITTPKQGLKTATTTTVPVATTPPTIAPTIAPTVPPTVMPTVAPTATTTVPPAG
jgi:copper transport protein